MITKRIVVGLINVLENGVLQVRQDTVVEEDGVELHRMYHRHVVEPDDDISNEEDWVKKIAATLWTPELIEARKAERERLRKLDPLIPPVDPNSIKPPTEPEDDNEKR